MPPKPKKQKLDVDDPYPDKNLAEIKRSLQEYGVKILETKADYIDALEKEKSVPPGAFDGLTKDELMQRMRDSGVWFGINRADYVAKLREKEDQRQQQEKDKGSELSQRERWREKLGEKEDAEIDSSAVDSFTNIFRKIRYKLDYSFTTVKCEIDADDRQTKLKKAKLNNPPSKPQDQFQSLELGTGYASFGDIETRWATRNRIITNQEVHQALKTPVRTDDVFKDIHTRLNQKTANAEITSQLHLLSALIPGYVSFYNIKLHKPEFLDFFRRTSETAEVGDIDTMTKLLALAGDKFDEKDIRGERSSFYELLGRTDPGNNGAKFVPVNSVAKSHGGKVKIDELPKILPKPMEYSGDLLREFNTHHLLALEKLYSKVSEEYREVPLLEVKLHTHDYPPLEERAQKFWDKIGMQIKESFSIARKELDALRSLSIEAGKQDIRFEGMTEFYPRLEPDFFLKVNGTALLVVELKRDEALLPLAAAHSEFLKVQEQDKGILGPIDAARGVYANCRYRYHYNPTFDQNEVNDRALQDALKDVAVANQDAVAHALQMSSQAIMQAVAAGAPLVGIATAEFVMICPISKKQDFSEWSPDGFCTSREGSPDKFYYMRDDMWGLKFGLPLILRPYELPGVGKVVGSLVVLECMQDPERREKLKHLFPDYDKEFDKLKCFDGKDQDKNSGNEKKGKGKGSGKSGETSGTKKAGESVEASFFDVFDDEHFATVLLAKMHMMESKLRRSIRLLSSVLRVGGGDNINVRSNLKLGRSVELHHAASDGYLSTTVFYEKVKGEKVVPVCSKFVNICSWESFTNEIEAYTRIARNAKVRKLVPKFYDAGVQVDLAKIDAFNKLFTGESPIGEYEKLTRNAKGTGVLKKGLTEGLYSLRGGLRTQAKRPKDGQGRPSETTVPVKDRYATIVSLSIKQVCRQLRSAIRGSGPVKDEELSAMFDHAPVTGEYEEAPPPVELLTPQWYLDMERLFPVKVDDEAEIAENRWDLYKALLECGIRHMDLEEGRNFMKTADGWKVFDFGMVEFLDEA